MRFLGPDLIPFIEHLINEILHGCYLTYNEFDSGFGDLGDLIRGIWG